MNFKQNLIAGAALAVCSFGAFAQSCPTAVTTSADAVAFVNNCVVDKTIFVGGASTMRDNIQTIAFSKVFDLTKMTPVRVVDKASVTGKASNGGNVRAFFGKNAAGKNIALIYNFNNGSAAGVSQLWAKPNAVAVPESEVAVIGKLKAGANDCAVSASAGAGTPASPYSVDCSTNKQALAADLALSDVNANELYAVYAAAAKGKMSDLTAEPLFLQSFGVAVSTSLYTALQAQNIADGLLAAGCQGDTSAACQPSIRSADYASLVSKTGAIKSVQALVPAAFVPAGTKLTLARRDDLSGTQASSNIFFVNGQCSARATVAEANKKSLDAKLIKAGALGGGLEIISQADAATFPSLNILNAAVTGDVTTAVSSPSDFAIGVRNVGSGGNITGAGGTGRFVKIDGVSPNFVMSGGSLVQDSVKPIASGNYPFAMTTFALYNTKAVAKDAEKKAMVDALIAGFKDSTLPSSGLAFFDGAANTKQSLVKRVNGNNCSPLVK